MTFAYLSSNGIYSDFSGPPNMWSNTYYLFGASVNPVLTLAHIIQLWWSPKAELYASVANPEKDDFQSESSL